MTTPDTITFTTEGRTYTWCGGFGAYFKSLEYRVRQGEMRVILGTIYQARFVRHRWWRRADEVCWTPAIDTDGDLVNRMNLIRRRIFQ